MVHIPDTWQVQPRVTEFGVAARLHRERAGFSQREVTEILGWGLGKLSRIETGRREKLPSRQDVTALDDLYETGGALMQITGYPPVISTVDELIERSRSERLFFETLESIVDAHKQRLLDDLYAALRRVS